MDFKAFLDTSHLGFFLDGIFHFPKKREPLILTSPVTGKAWKNLYPASVHDVRKAIQAAQEAFIQWKKIPAFERGNFLRKIGTLIEAHQENFAYIMAMETGKPISQGIKEALYAADYFHWYAGEAERIYGQTILSQHSLKRLLLTYEPVGVSVSITPWNFPLAMAARKIAAALAAGCTMINKPSEDSPITMLFFAEICSQVKLPKGVVNILPGPSEEIGNVFMKSNDVKKLSFTGGTETGKLLYQQAAATLKKLTLELGGHAPLLVFDDADLEIAVKGTIEAKFRNNGQTCIAPNRIFVQEGIYADYLCALIEKVKQLKIGDPFDRSTDLSPILHPTTEKKIKKHIDDALEKGARCELKGTHLFEPCILSEVTEDMLIFQEETFGPVLGLARFKTEEEGIAKANHTSYGLASYVFTSDLHCAIRVTEGLEFGIIGLNDGLPSTYQASFGGVKHSGFGREGGPAGIKEYLVEKFISMGMES